jgi:hypothetical protein
MVTSACATEWLDGHPYFNDYSTTPTESTTITISTPTISGSDVSFTFTLTDADGFHQAHFFETITESYGFADLSLLQCASLDSGSTSTTVSFTTRALTSETDSVTLRVMDALGRSTEKLFTVDLSALPDSTDENADNDSPDGGTDSGSTMAINMGKTLPQDVNKDGIVDIRDLVEVGSNFGDQGQSRSDVNGDGVVNIIDLSLIASAFGSGTAAPSLLSHNRQITPTRAQIQEWLHEARQMNLKDPEFQRGIFVLEQLLGALTPKKTILLPNYPNPFNPETWIPYQLSEAAEVSIRIYDVTGNLVRSLDLGHQGPGFYHSRSEAAYWDGKNNLNERVASGIYFYHIQAGEFSATRRMLILK